MVYLIKKNVKGETYYYLNHSVRLEDRVKTLSYYLGKGPFSQSQIDYLLKEKSQMILLEAEFLKIFSKRSVYQEHILPTSFINIIERLKEINRIMTPFNKTYFEKFEEDLRLRYVHGSTAIEGNTLSLRDAQLILEEDTPAGNTLREMHEILNYKELFRFLSGYNGDINLKFILKIHEILMKNIDDENAGRLRNIDISISGSDYDPTPFPVLEDELTTLIDWYKENRICMFPIEIACHFHQKFVEIHPFIDGNGRVSRELLNFILIKNNYPRLVIPFERRGVYLRCIDVGNSGELTPFIIFIAGLLIEDSFKPVDVFFNQLKEKIKMEKYSTEISNELDNTITDYKEILSIIKGMEGRIEKLNLNELRKGKWK
ncbi:MAG: Fic/DOC family protein [Candidatus Methanofastidiosum methylothiophilum]|uniref:Fic/DOC family protein n=1 Tax=Candidatus Methanofastidiosum methylothiophilum TaxID=1705564 RepID=A0A150II81_9EURY|nr:MAG: Fic/DOC family protein [Candidatus Methanofastidiosum methylthiophilus]KYC46803.1 MAG: Fic/DOC family protein [Candidatus Methanofastidiosum methylthiophilus]KYC49481.1 MAG: Fic/DOC family protein [Candidatus Methanofastidiosum methylthiophilus]